MCEFVSVKFFVLNNLRTQMLSCNNKNLHTDSLRAEKNKQILLELVNNLAKVENFKNLNYTFKVMFI